MKPAIIAIVVVTIAIAYWQRTTLEELRILEAGASAVSNPSDDGTPVVEPLPSVSEHPSVTNPVSDSELAEFTQTLLAVKSEFETDRWFKMSTPGTQLSHPVLCETLRRLNRKQIRAVLDAWRAEPPTNERSAGLHRFMGLADRVNPAEALPLLYEPHKDGERTKMLWHVSTAFEHWFRMDPSGLLKWAKDAGMPTDFDNQCEIWTDAVVALQNPTAESVGRFVAHKTYHAENAARAIAVKLDTQEARTAFFQSLHGATDGVFDKFAVYMWPLVSRVPFEQLAIVADGVPDFRSSVEEEINGAQRIALGSFRFEIAAKSRDSTAARRWEWLTKREIDSPSDIQLGRLVNEWCETDYPDTASWIRSLPPGALRDAAGKKVVAFLKYNGREDLIADWELR